MRRNGWFLLGLLIFSAYFAHFVLPGLKSRFNIDDPMNLHNAWYPGGLPIVKGILLFFAPTIGLWAVFISFLSSSYLGSIRCRITLSSLV